MLRFSRQKTPVAPGLCNLACLLQSVRQLSVASFVERASRAPNIASLIGRLIEIAHQCPACTVLPQSLQGEREGGGIDWAAGDAPEDTAHLEPFGRVHPRRAGTFLQA